MSKIQELLAKSRGQNGTITQSILQSGPEKAAVEVKEKEAAVSKPPEPIKKLSLAERLGKKPNGLSNIPGVGEAKSNTIHSVVEQRLIEPIAEVMPSGLSLMAQMKWKKEYAVNSNKKPNPPANNVEPLGEEKIIPLVPPEEGAQLSASQAADKEKSNDGLANIEELRHNLAYLANNIENKEAVADVVRTICTQLKNSPELTPSMTNADVNLVVRAARICYQIAAMKKQERADTRKNKGKDVEALDAFFKDAGLNFKF